MVAMNEIEDLAGRIGREFHARKVVLFGSHARGDANEDSDVDLLVILPFRGRSVDQTVRIHLELRHPFPVDLIVRTPQVIRRRLQMEDYFIQSILDEGKVLYEADRR